MQTEKNPFKVFLHQPLTLRRTLLALAVLAALAALGFGAYRGVSELMLEARVRNETPRLLSFLRAQRQTLVAAINDYKAALGSFPPDHVLGRDPLMVDAVTNQLLYELTGTVYNPAKQTFTAERFEPVAREMIRKLFGVDDFNNAVAVGTKPKQFLASSESIGSWEAHDDPDVNVLRPNFYWEGLDEVMVRLEVSPWRYNASHPSHNPNGFDLWVEVRAGDQHLVVGNWKEAE